MSASQAKKSNFPVADASEEGVPFGARVEDDLGVGTVVVADGDAVSAVREGARLATAAAVDRAEGADVPGDVGVCSRPVCDLAALCSFRDDAT